MNRFSFIITLFCTFLSFEKLSAMEKDFDSIKKSISAISPSGRWHVVWQPPHKNAPLALYSLILFDSTKKNGKGTAIVHFPWNNTPRFSAENIILFVGETRTYQVRFNGSGKVIALGTGGD